MGKMFYIKVMKAVMFLNNKRIFTRGIVKKKIKKSWVWLYSWCQRDTWACGWCRRLPLASSGEWVPTCSAYRLLHSWESASSSLVPESSASPFLFPPSKGTDSPLACPVNTGVTAAISPASLWDNRTAATPWKTVFTGRHIVRIFVRHGVHLPTIWKCSEATISMAAGSVESEGLPHLGIGAELKVFRLERLISSVSYLMFLIVLLNGK